MQRRANRVASNKARISKLGDLFDLIKQHEMLLETYYGAIRDTSTDNGARLLSYYLGKHYRQFCSTLDTFSLRKIKRMRERELQQSLELVLDEWTALTAPPPARIEGKALLEMAIRYNRQLKALYTTLLRQPLAKDTLILISTLKRQEDNDSATFRKMVAIHYY